jgi:hypothetical protein
MAEGAGGGVSAQKPLHKMSAQQVFNACDGDHSDGGNLVLRVRGDSGSWVFRYTAPSGKRREMGLGVAIRGSLDQAGESLIAARGAAHKAREQLRAGLDPIDEKNKQRDMRRNHVWPKRQELNSEFDFEEFALEMANAAYQAVKKAAMGYQL